MRAPAAEHSISINLVFLIKLSNVMMLLVFLNAIYKLVQYSFTFN
jgi:hypothetical protein